MSRTIPALLLLAFFLPGCDAPPATFHPIASPELLEEPDPGLEGHWADPSGQDEGIWTIMRDGEGWAVRLAPQASFGDMGITFGAVGEELWAVATPFTLGGSHLLELHADEEDWELFQIPVHVAVRYEVRRDSLLVDFVGAGEWAEWAEARELSPQRAHHPRSVGCRPTPERDCSWTSELFTHPTPVLQTMLAEIMSDADVSWERDVLTRVRMDLPCHHGDAPTETGDLPMGGAVEGSLIPDDCLGPELEYRDYWSLVLEAPATIRLDLSSEDFDTYLVIQDSTGRYVAGDDDGGEGTDSRIEVALAPGRYHVVASALRRGQRGRYSLSAIPGGSR